MVAGYFVLMCLTFAWVISTDGNPRLLGVPLGFLPVLAVFFGLWLMGVLAQVPSRAERRAVKGRGLRTFGVGVIPFTRTYLIIDQSGLRVISGTGNQVASAEWSRVSVAGLQASQFGVGLAVSIDETWYDIPIVLEVAGPAAAAWSWDAMGAKQRLLRAVRESLDGRGPIYLV